MAAVVGDELLVEEGALRAYNLLTPLLASKDTSPLLHQALSAAHLALSGVKDMMSIDLTGMKCTVVCLSLLVNWHTCQTREPAASCPQNGSQCILHLAGYAKCWYGNTLLTRYV